MKRILPLLFFLALGISLFANPIVAPGIKFSELCFDNKGDLTIELAYYAMYPGADISKIVLSSSTDSVVITGLIFNDVEGVFVYRKNSFTTPFHINPLGDSLTVKYYWHDFPAYPEILIFGNYKNAQIPSPKVGQSICGLWYTYAKDNTPTIGALNDDTGIYGTLTGVVYDKYLMPVVNRRLSFGYPVNTSANGSYSTRVLAQPNSFDELFYSIGENVPTKYVKLDPVSYSMEPDSVIVRDIHLTGDLETGLNDLPENNIFRLYPNPMNKKDQLHYEIDLPVKTAGCSLDLLNVDGKLLLTKALSESKGEIEMPPVIGVVVVNLRVDNKIIATARIIVNHE